MIRIITAFWLTSLEPFHLRKEVCLKSPFFAHASALPFCRQILQCTEKYFVPLVIIDDVGRLILLKITLMLLNVFLFFLLPHKTNQVLLFKKHKLYLFF